MPSKLFWVLAPIFLYACVIAVLVWRGRAPSRLALNVQTSLLLMVYLLSTAGLGVFWVANQQLPAFDWHYLFGYSTLLLVTIHLSFNLATVLRWLRSNSTKAVQSGGAARVHGASMLAKVLALFMGLAAMFFLGMRHSDSGPDLRWNAHPANTGTVAAVTSYHEFSSESRTSVFRRAPSIDWGAPPPAFKQYPDQTHVALSRAMTTEHALSATLRAPQQPRAALHLDALGELLYLSAGITAWRGDTAYRAAPSAGALFPSELYLLARQVEGLPAGLYHYDAEHQQLDLLSASPDINLGAPEADAADAVVILTSIFRRTAYKYRDRAYRYAMADAGHLLENLRLAGHKAGLQAKPLAQFDEAIAAKALGVDNIEEGVLAMLELRRVPVSAMPDSATQRMPYVSPSAPANSAIGVTGLVHQATSLQQLNEAVEQAAMPDVIVLPVPQASLKGVVESITHRRSKRRFLDQAVPLATLSSMLADIAQTPQLSNAVRINLVVKKVAGLAPGIYRYLPQHALQRVREGGFSAEAQSAALSQEVIGAAAVVLVLSGERQHMFSQGARGYRHAFLEAGMISERWLLSAVARDLAACPVGAFYDDEAAILLALDPQREWVLHFAALGISAEQ